MNELALHTSSIHGVPFVLTLLHVTEYGQLQGSAGIAKLWKTEVMIPCLLKERSTP